MKNRFLLTPFLLVAASAAAQPAHATLLSFNTFNNSNLTADHGIKPATTTSTFGSDLKFGNPSSGTTVNANGGGGYPALAPASGTTGSLQVYTGTSGNNGKSVTFAVNTRGFGNLKVDYATRKGGSGFTTQTFQYSVDNGANFVTFGSPYTVNNSYTAPSSLRSYNLSSIKALGANNNALFRIIFTGGTGVASGTNTNQNSIDNFSINAVATPEPSTWAMMGLGLGALAFVARRRKREAGEAASFAGLTA